MIVGVLDTGIWPEHPSFADPGISHPGRHVRLRVRRSAAIRSCGATFTCNDKLIGAYAFTDTYMAVVGAEPGEYCNNGDGRRARRATPTATGRIRPRRRRAARVASAPLFGIERGPISGIAPGAHVIMYRVCLDQGCFQSDSVAAIAAGDHSTAST